MIRLTLLVLALYLICCAAAMGQSAPAGGEARGDVRETRATGVTREYPPMINSDDHGIGGTGASAATAGSVSPPPVSGSLLKRALSAPPDPTRPRLSQVSLMAVAEPKPRTLKKHDIVQIIVQEQSESSSKGTADLKKNSDLDMKADSYIKLNVAKLAIEGGTTPVTTPELKVSGQRNFKGDATVDRSDSMTARFGAEVIDVKPNGTIVLQAHKHIRMDEEDQDFLLTGVCRVEDVSPDNSVLSNVLHDLDIRKSTRGAVTDTNKRGIIPRLLDFVNPF